MNILIQVVVTVSILIIVIMFICWKMPSDKIKDAKELLKVILPKLPITSIIEALNKKGKMK